MKCLDKSLIVVAAVVMVAGGPAFAQDVPGDHAEIDDLPVSVSIDVIFDEDDVDDTITIINNMASEQADHPVVVEIPDLHSDDSQDDGDLQDDDGYSEEGSDEDPMDEDFMDEDSMDEDSMDEDSMDEDSMDEISIDEDPVIEIPDSPESDD